jgi:hypothetical protein
MILIGGHEIRFSMGGITDIAKTGIPVGNWLIQYDQHKLEFFLTKVDDFTIPKKTYGNCKALSTRYNKTFKEGNGNLGVALSGLKGTGKSLTAKQTAVDSRLPILLISQPFVGAQFNAFVADIRQECVIFVDEFEKVYNEKEKQEAFLSILDGVFMGKKMFLFTSNETSKYSNYLINRPGRVHYMEEYERISDEMLEDIVKDNLANQEHADELKNIIHLIEDANIDMVFALIRECNMYQESPKEAVRFLNIKIAASSTYEVRIIDLTTNYEFTSLYRNSPLSSVSIYLDAYMTEESIAKLPKLEKKAAIASDEPEDWELEEENDDSLETYRRINIITDECTITQNKREILLCNDKFKIRFTPQETRRYYF